MSQWLSTNRWRKLSLVSGGALAVGLMTLLVLTFDSERAGAATDTLNPGVLRGEIQRLTQELDRARGDLAVKALKLDRLTAVAQYSAAYEIPADVAGRIYDASLAEGIHPSLGYQLVKVESGFRSHARSTRGALGYTQIQIRTARTFDSTVSERQLLDPDTNLRYGFRWLKRLLRQFDNDLELALRAYNLGATAAVATLVDSTQADNGAGYARAVISGVKGKSSGGNR